VTPEAKIKRSISAVLRKYKDYIYVHMPVPGGYGRSTLDYLCFVCGLGFAIEAKREDGKPTLRQQGVIEEMRRAGAKVFVVNGHKALEELDRWLAQTVALSLPTTTTTSSSASTPKIKPSQPRSRQ
jgi:hypothetical protein